MKKSDILICSFMYLFSFFFLYFTMDFPVKARSYPYFVIGLLIILTTVRVSHMVRDYRREHKVINDMGEVFDGFLPRQFRVMFSAFILFFILMYFLGFYIAAFMYLLVCLLFPYPEKTYHSRFSLHDGVNLWNLRCILERTAP